jgi:hypothetical protein
LNVFGDIYKDKACANKLHDTIEEVVKATKKIMVKQNIQFSDLRFHVSKKL